MAVEERWSFLSGIFEKREMHDYELVQYNIIVMQMTPIHLHVSFRGKVVTFSTKKHCIQPNFHHCHKCYKHSKQSFCSGYSIKIWTLYLLLIYIRTMYWTVFHFVHFLSALLFGGFVNFSFLVFIVISANSDLSHLGE